MKALLVFVLSTLLLIGCSVPEDVPQTTAPLQEVAVPEETIYMDTVVLDIQEPELEAEVIIQPPEPIRPDILKPEATGEQVAKNDKAIIDYSNIADGYVMVLYTADKDCRLKVRVESKNVYTYNLTKGEWSVFPLTDESGTYQIRVYENTSGSSYALAMATELEVTLADEFAPFLRPNQYVNFSETSKAVEVAWALTKDIENPLGKVEAIYNYVVTELSYDNEKARTVKSGYIPVLDEILESKKGICFDYASLMTAMLRSQQIPCKMVFGYTGGAYHAWISVWTEDTGWVDGVIFFDGVAWQRLDPTFASYENQSDAIMKYIGNGKNYKEKYFY